MSLPAELQTEEWQAAFSALHFDDPAAAFRDDDIAVQATHIGWHAVFRRYYPCCGAYGDRATIWGDDLNGLAIAIKTHCDGLDASGASGCPNRQEGCS